jgi:hypothetical protein
MHLKGNKKGKNGGKDETFEYDVEMPEIIIPDMPDMKELNKSLENMKFDMDKNVHIYKFDKEKFKKDMEGFKFDMKDFNAEMKDFKFDMKEFGKEMDNLKFDDMHIKFDDTNNPENNFMFKFLGDSTKGKGCNIIIRSSGKRDSLRSLGRNLRVLKRMERLSDLKEGTTEETKEIDLGNGKIAKITTKRIVVISEKPKSETKKEDISSSIKIFPNPNQGVFTLEFVAENQGDARITITSVQGKQVYQEDVKNLKGTYKKEIKLSDATSPNYVLRIEQGGKSYTKQIIVNR